ncbi:hypothetical protein DH2020_015603 [Rehmannia glutinosa]|uniref:non-specific serine/threonine protein kinase n=1 Tax=Rehmannia glutinosa TaxID=99300 RepID=A0ABR0WUP5_REHGL
MLRDIEEATNGLAYENVIGSGDYGEVFQGFLMDNTQVAVKKLFSNRSSKESFVREAEAMMLIRHKNLVKFFDIRKFEETSRMLVCEYVDNGNLEQWLHRFKSKDSPLTWTIRMKIIIGIAKGLAYLHEDTEPPIVHGNIKSSNILVDQQWNPKISNVEITKLLGPEYNHLATAPPIGMPGIAPSRGLKRCIFVSYIAPEYDSHRGSDEKSDVYSFGVLIMETFLGKTVVEKELKRILLIALRCVDFEVEKRPQMGKVIHMLQPRDLLPSDENVIKRQTSQSISLKEDQT